MSSVVITMLMISFVQINFAMDQSNPKPIPIAELYKYEGQAVAYKKSNNSYQKITLGKRVLESKYYEARLEKEHNGKILQHGILCNKDQLYLLSDAQMQ